MKITCVINSLANGGAERIMSILAGAWSERHEVSLLLFEQAFSFYRIDPRVRIVSLGASFRDKNLWGKLCELNRLRHALRLELEALQPEIVISFMDQANVLTLCSAPPQTRVIVSERSAPARSSLSEKGAILGQLLLYVRNFFYRQAHAVVVQTDGAQRYFIEHGISTTKVIPNPVVKPNEEPTDKTLPTPCIVSMGRLVALKRFDLLIDAFSTIAGKHPQWHLAILGEGPLHKKLHARACRYNLADRIHLLGASTHPHAVLRQAEIFALASDSEGFPGSLCEAMSTGRAVVSSNCDFGPSTIIRQGIDGLLVAPGDATAMAAALDQLISDPQLRAELGSAARSIVERFSLERVLELWEECFGGKNG